MKKNACLWVVWYVGEVSKTLHKLIPYRIVNSYKKIQKNVKKIFPKDSHI